MKPFRLLLVGAAALLVVAIAAVVTVFNSSVQTWIARRALASRPDLHATVTAVSAGLKNVAVKNLRLESHGAVLTLPALDVDLPLVSAGMSHKVLVTRCVAKGWTLDLTKVTRLADFATPPHRGPATRESGEFSLLPSALAADPAPVAIAQVFQGVFAQLQLPVDLAVDGMALEGEIILPGSRGHARVTLGGGGLAAGHEGKFDLTLTAALTSTSVSTLEAHAAIAAMMDTPRTFTRLGVKGDATASGPKFPRGVKLATDLAAARAATGEDYTITLATENKQLIAVQAALPANARKLDGSWKIDARDSDLAPFTLGRALPAFVADGAGRFDLDPASLDLHASGKLNVASDNLAPLQPMLAVLGKISVTAEFDLTQAGDLTRVEKFRADVTGAKPVAALESRQILEFNRATRGLKVADPAKDLFAVTLQGLPLAWAQPALGTISLTGGDLRGELIATASNGGFSLRSKSPLAIANVTATQPGRPLVRDLDVALNASVDYTPQGWQAALAPLTVRRGDATLLTLDAKAGQLAGVDQPVKATGKFSASLPALLAQPVATGTLQLTRGEAAGDFAANLGATREVQARLSLTDLAADPKLTTERLPTITTDVRADFDASGQITLNAPLVVERDGRKSDLAIAGTITSGPTGLTVAARVTSNHLVLEDVKILAAPLAPAPSETPAVAAATPAAPAPEVKPVAPPWTALNGQLALTFKEVVWSDSFRANDVTGVLRLDASSMKLEQMRAGLGGGGEAKVNGAVTFDAKSDTPYALASDVAVSEFDPAPLFRALDSSRPATVEGKFNVTSKLAGRAVSLAGLADTAHGDFQLTSKSGVFRGLPVNVASKMESVGKVASSVAFLGNLAGAMTGRKDYSDIGTRAQALAEVTKMWQAISYDQLSVVIARDDALNTSLKDFTLISPELRLTGGGTATHIKDKPLLDETLAMEFKLRARGHHAELLKYLGALEPTPDELGYSACTLPIKVGGTIGKPDTSELDRALTSLAVEKSGVSDKASELLNKLLGGGK